MRKIRTIWPTGLVNDPKIRENSNQQIARVTVAEDADKLLEELAKARSEGMERGWVVMLSVAFITIMAVIVAIGVYIFLQLF